MRNMFILPFEEAKTEYNLLTCLTQKKNEKQK